MRVVYLGNFEPLHSTETHIAASLQHLGIEVVEAQQHTVGLDALREMCAGADVFLFTRTLGWPCPWGKREAGAEFLRSLDIPSASWHLDLYLGLKRGSPSDLASDPFWMTNYVFTPDGDPESQAIFEAAGIAHHYLRPAVFHGECYIAEPRVDLRADVAFVGSGSLSPRRGYHPEWPYRGELLRFLHSTYGDRFIKHGNETVNGGMGCARNHELNQVYASTKVVVGDTLCLGRGDRVEPRFAHVGYWSDRIYETLGRGGFLIHPWIEGLDGDLVPGEHFIPYPYGDFDELRRLIDHYLEADDERERIRRAGHEHVKARCTYLDRAREVLGAMGIDL